MTSASHIDIPYIAQQLGKGKEKKTARGYDTLCPIHGDSDPSLNMENKNGKIAVWCQVCKDNIPIIDYLKQSNLWPVGGVIGNPLWTPHEKSSSAPRTYTSKFLTREQTWERDNLEPIAFYDYLDTDGSFIFQVVRLWDKDKQKKTFKQYYRNARGNWCWSNVKNNVKYVPYNLPGIERARRKNEWVGILEGEKDAEQLTADGIEGSSNPKGGCNWTDAYTPYFEGVKTFMIPDNDWIGYEHLNQVGRSFKKHKQQLFYLELPGWSLKDDYSDWRQNFDFDFFNEIFKANLKEWTEPVPNPWPDPKKTKIVENENGPTTPTNVVVLPLGDLEMFTDSGNANRFARQYSGLAMFSRERGWMRWDGKRICMNADLEVREMAKEIARSISHESEGNHGERLKWAKESFGRSRLSAMLAVAESLPGIKVERDKHDRDRFDADPYIINTQSGVYDLRTGERFDHDQKFLCTRITDCGVDRDREPEMFLTFLGTITGGNEERIEFLQRLSGYWLTGKTSLQQAHFIWGKGLNGKSIFIDTMATQMGTGSSGYAASPEAAMFLMGQQQSQKYDFSQLVGKRLAAVGEVQAGARLDEAKLKTFTGDSDLLPARFLFGEPFEYPNQCKVVFRCNDLPVIVNRDNGIWRRIVKVPFDVTIPEKNVIRNLMDILREEWDAIMWWRIQGAMKVLRDINTPAPLLTPVEFDSLTEEYRDDMDTTGMFIEECCQLYADCKLYSSPIDKAPESIQDEWSVSNRELSRAYQSYCKDFHISAKGSRRFNTDLTEKGLVKAPRKWLGLKLRPSEE